MDSTLNPQNYANNPMTMLGSQIVTLVSEKATYDTNIGKFTFPYITSTTQTSEAFERTLPKNNTSNVINKNNLGISRITTSNYIELAIPRHLFTIKEIITTITPNASKSDGYYVGCNPKATHQIIYNEFLKGQQFIILNLGGNVNKPYIIGVI